MIEQNEPLSLAEYVLRRIHKSHYKAELPVPVVRVAFQPNRKDTQGISVYRERFVTSVVLAKTGRKSGEYYVARLSVEALVKTIGLSIEPDPQENELPGHCLIPEIRFDTPSRESKDLQRRLAAMASRSIVYMPEST